jgi:hypothetical protein
MFFTDDILKIKCVIVIYSRSEVTTQGSVASSEGSKDEEEEEEDEEGEKEDEEEESDSIGIELATTTSAKAGAGTSSSIAAEDFFRLAFFVAAVVGVNATEAVNCSSPPTETLRRFRLEAGLEVTRSISPLDDLLSVVLSSATAVMLSSRSSVVSAFRLERLLVELSSVFISFEASSGELDSTSISARSLEDTDLSFFFFFSWGRAEEVASLATGVTGTFTG